MTKEPGDRGGGVSNNDEAPVAEGEPTAVATSGNGAGPESARTLADWEPTLRVITEEEGDLLDSVTVSTQAPIYLRALIATGNSIVACSAIGIDPSTPRKWKRRDTHFAAILADIREEIKERWNAVAEYRALHGFEERIYDKHGNLAGRKIKQDPSFLRAMLGAQDPEHWGSRGERDGNVTITVMRGAE